MLTENGRTDRETDGQPENTMLYAYYCRLEPSFSFDYDSL